MKIHFLPSEQRERVTRFRASLRALGILLLCVCIGHVASALYLIENPAQIAVPQGGSGSASHDVALISPAWVVSTMNDGPKATAQMESWQSPVTLLRDAQVDGVHLYLYKVESPDPSRSAALQYAENGQEVTVQGKPNLRAHVTLADDGLGTIDQDVSGVSGRPLNPVGDTGVLGVIAVDANGKAVVVTTSQLLKLFPELAH